MFSRPSGHSVVAMVFTAADFFSEFPYIVGLTKKISGVTQCRFFHSSPNCRMILYLTFFDFPMMQLFMVPQIVGFSPLEKFPMM